MPHSKHIQNVLQQHLIINSLLGVVVCGPLKKYMFNNIDYLHFTCNNQIKLYTSQVLTNTTFYLRVIVYILGARTLFYTLQVIYYILSSDFINCGGTDS